MNGAELKATLKSGGRVFGTMISVGRNPHWVPALSGVGLDYVVIDTEHNPRSRGELGDYLTMFNTTGVVPIVRIPIPDSHYVTMAMDAGAQGVLAPYCETADQVKEVVAAAKWRPLKGEAVDRIMQTGEHVSDATRGYLEKLAQHGSLVGLHRLLADQLVATGKSAEELIVEVVAVGDDDERWVGHVGVKDDPPGVERHRQALARSLRVPHHTHASVA